MGTSSSSGNQGQPNPSVSINDGDLQPEKSSPTDQDSEQKITSSWLYAVKGKIAKTVEEKYTEYKNEKEMRKLHQNSNASSNLNSQFYNPEGSFDDFLLDNDDDLEPKRKNC